MSDKIKTSSQLQGLTQLLVKATTGITDVVEDMHKRVVHPPFLPSTPLQNLITNIADLTFKNIKLSTQVIGGGLDAALGHLAPMLGEINNSEKIESMRAVLNGIVGDYLVEQDNPLQIPMQFRYKSKYISLDRKNIEGAYANINGKILLMVHGSCMNDIQWTQGDHNHGEVLSKELGLTTIYLHYNSGRHISTNGQNLNELLEKLINNWPVPVEELVVIAHSMGGLVTRSAMHYALQEKLSWTKHLKKVIFLGTPHHGSSLERIGNYLDVILKSIPYVKPFARLGKIRSAGVTDLRYGNLIDEDWQGNDRFEFKRDKRHSIPLPNKVACYSIAAAIGKQTDHLSNRIKGDRMVGIKSALGQHKDATKDLGFKKKNTWVAYENDHLGLLSSLKIYSKIKTWV